MPTMGKVPGLSTGKTNTGAFAVRGFLVPVMFLPRRHRGALTRMLLQRFADWTWLAVCAPGRSSDAPFNLQTEFAHGLVKWTRDAYQAQECRLRAACGPLAIRQIDTRRSLGVF